MSSKYHFRAAATATTAFSGDQVSNEIPSSPTPTGVGLTEGNKRKRKRSKQNSFDLIKMQVFANKDVTPPHQLASEGKLEELKALIETFGLTLKEVDENGDTMLHAATKTGQIQVMQYLIDSGININATNMQGNTALHIAVLNEQSEALCLLLESKASDVVLNNNKDAPLHILFRSRNKDLIAAFLQYPSIDLVIPGYRKRTPLHIIADLDNFEALEILHNSICLTTIFKEKASFRLCAADEDNLTPIHLAARSGSAKTLDYMMSKCKEHGYPPEVVLSFLDEENSTPLHAAVDGGHFSVVEVLLKHGADPTHIKEDQPPPVHVACSQGKLDMVQLMVRHAGKKILQSHDQFGQTPLHRSASGINCTHILSYLIAEGVEVNPIDNNGRTPLVYAIFVGSLWAVKDLLAHGADPMIKDREGQNALHIGIHRHRKAIVGCLLDLPVAAQLVTDGDSQKRNPLHIALSMGHGDLVPPLVATIRLQLGACIDSSGNNFLHLAAGSGDHRALAILLDIPSCQRLLNKTNGCGGTPLHRATGGGHTRCVELLLSHGAMSHKCHTGVTPFMYACLNGHTQCAELTHEAYPFQKDWTDDKGNSALHFAVMSGKPCIVAKVLSLGVAITHNHDGHSFFDLIIEKPDSKLAMAAIGSDRWQEILDLVSPHKPHPMIGLIQRLPEVAKMVLDRCHIQSSYDKQDPQFWEKFNFKYLKLDQQSGLENADDGPEETNEKVGQEEPVMMNVLNEPTVKYKTGSTVIQEVINTRCRNILEVLRTMIRYKRVSLLTHPVVKAFIKSKWRDYGRFVYSIYILLFALQVVLLSVFIIATPNPAQLRGSNSVEAAGNTSGSGELGDELQISIGSNIVRHFTFIFAILNIVTWILSTFSLGRNALNLVHNAFIWVDFLAILFTIIYLIPIHGHNSAVWHVGPLASFFCWFGLFLKLQPFDLFGVYVTMFMVITRSVLLVLTICFLLIAAFSLSFYTLLGNIPIFSTVGYSFFTNFGYMLGEIDYTLPIVEDKDGNLEYETLSFLFIIVVAVLMSIVIMNLLIGLAVGDIDQIQRNAIAEKRRVEVSIFTRLDYSMPKRLLQKFDRRSYTSFPNSKRSFIRKLWKIFWNLLKGESDETNFEKNTDVDDEIKISTNQQIISQLQSLSERLDDLATVQQTLLAAIQKIQSEQKQQEETSEEVCVLYP